jgi:biotin-dependent carboxylase-like uncharacterized protein
MSAPADSAGPALVVLAGGSLATIQDHGRVGWGRLGVPRSGPFDRPAFSLANRLVGNRTMAAGVEITMGGFTFLAVRSSVVALTGAVCPIRIDTSRAAGADLEEHIGFNTAVRVPAGVSITLGVPKVGVRTYLSIRGSIAGTVDGDGPVLGSLATDGLSGLGPRPLISGVGLLLGKPHGPMPGIDVVPAGPMPGSSGPAKVRILPGPRLEWCADAMSHLASTPWTVDANSNRIAVRLRGAPVERVCHDELPPEGLMPGAVQIPPNGMPVIFGPDHPTTGGYPVVAVVHPDDQWVLAQLRPGQRLGMGGYPGGGLISNQGR